MARKVLVALGFVLAMGLSVGPAEAQSRRSDALVIVNSGSDAYDDFQHFVKPYLDHFGVPYVIRDIVGSEIGTDVGNYALVIIGHRRLDPSHTLLTSTEESNISAAVFAGTGLVNFDNDLSADGVIPRYAFVNDVFGFGYVASTSGSGVSFPDPTAHYVTARHSGGIGTNGMTLAGVTLPGDVTGIAMTGTQPFLAVTTYGTGRALQWGSYDWMSHGVKGPMYGLDDLVWCGIVWAARKPFVMQGLPPFLTMRVDDESGNFEWIHIANEFGIKPWAGLFYHNIDDAEAADLSALTNAGLATASIHAKSGTFFYFNHGVGDYDAATVAANFAEGTAWHTAKNIPIAKYVLPHYYEFGTNVFQGLRDWGVEFVGTQMDPGNGYGAPWVINGPFRLFETGGSGGGSPQYYADYMTIPGHSEFNGQFFNCVTEIRDDAGYEWYPNLGDVPGTIGRGTRQTIRALDAMALPTLFTHGYYVSGSWGGSAPANWRAILSGIMTNIASYNPINVTMDYACQYVRAVHDSDISAAVYDPALNRVTATFSGTTDLATKFYVFSGEGSAITQFLVDVPQFTASTQVDYTLPGPLARVDVSPNPGTVVAGATLQFAATGYDADNNPIPNLQFAWSVVNGGGTIEATGRFTAGVTPGTFTNTVAATFGTVQGFATAIVTAPVLDHFDFATIGSPKYKDAPFTITVTARDDANNQVLGFVGMAALTDTTGTVTPSTIGPFSAGVWQGPVTIAALGTAVTLGVSGSAAAGTSNAFNVTTMPQGASSIWPTAPTPGTALNPDPNPLEVGVKFRAAVDGDVTALRFYKGAGNSGTHVGHLWSAAGVLLATATFTNETTSGWQQVALSPSVPIQADVTYIASYHTSTGYAADRPYFTTGVDSPPLRALRDGEDGGNGVYKYDTECASPPCFPNQTYQSSNYWVDIVFVTPDNTPPTVSATSPADGAVGVDAFANVTATFSEAMSSATISTATFRLRVDGETTDIPAVVTYSGVVATLDPVGTLAYGTRYRVTVSGTVTDVVGNPLGANHEWTFDTAAEPQCPCTIWPPSSTPANAWNNDLNGIEVGVKFRSSLPGFVTALRFYKGAGNSGTHVGHLWDAAGNLLGQATFTGETSSGWQEVTLPSQVSILPGTTYVASYHSTTGYAISRPYFGSAYNSPPLRALQDGEDGGNGVYKYDSTCATPPCMPDLTHQSTNYWVDVVFNTLDHTAPAVISTSPAAGAVSIETSTNVAATFSEAMNASTITTATFRLRELGAPADVPASVSYSGFTATLDPTAPLASGKTYQATVSGGVTDVAGNPMGADHVWTFTTSAVTTVTHTTAADFGAALPNTCSVVAHTGDGEVTLVPAMGEEFSGTWPPSGWVSHIWNTGGTVSVSEGKLTVNGARANPDPSTNNYGPGRSLEFSATYASATLYQQGGFGGGLNAPTTPGTEIYNTGPMATFTTEGNGLNLYARAWTSAGGSNNVSPSLGTSWIGSAHRYRIVWNASNVQYYMDGSLAHTWNVAVSGNMRPAFSEYYATGGALSVDWMRMSPFGANCALESRVIDAGLGVHWLDLMATGSMPAGTGYSFETRSGNTGDPNDGSWSAWVAVSGNAIGNPNGRYLQYRATLTTSDDRVTPEVQQVTVRFDSCTAEVCNGLDDDCDGAIDEGNPGGGATCTTVQPGVCAPGTEQCSAGAIACVSNVEPSPEACDGLDNDCNGTVDDGRGTISIADGIEGIPGQTVVVPIQVSNVDEMGVYAAELDVSFDARVLNVFSVAGGAALSDKDCTVVPNLANTLPPGTGSAKVAIYCTRSLTGGASLVDLSFQVVSAIYGSGTPLGFATAKLNEGCPATSADSGSFVVRGPEICDNQDNDGDTLVDEICTVSGKVVYYRNHLTSGEPSAKPVPNVGIAATGTVPAQTSTDTAGAYAIGGQRDVVTITAMNKYGDPRAADHNGAISSTDAARVAMASVGNGSLSVNQTVAGDVTGNGTIGALDASYIARFSAQLVDHFPVATTTGSDWKFFRCSLYGAPPDDPGCGPPVYDFNGSQLPQSDANLYAVLYGDVTGDWAPAPPPPAPGAKAGDSPSASKPPEPLSPLSTVLSMPDTAGGGPGSSVSVPISATPGDGILGIDMTIQYDPAVVSATNVATSGIAAAAGFALVRNLNTPGVIIISMYATSSAISGSGEILRIDFNVVGAPGATSALTFTRASVNEGAIPASLDHGLFTVTCAGVANGTVCNDGNACTLGDRCSAGVCTGTAVTAPGEVAGVGFLGDGVTVAWTVSADAGAVYDVVRGRLAALPVGPGGGDEVCAANDLTTTTFTDAEPVAPGDGLWYLVRAANACAEGTYGNDAPYGGPPSPRVTNTCQ